MKSITEPEKNESTLRDKMLEAKFPGSMLFIPRAKNVSRVPNIIIPGKSSFLSEIIFSAGSNFKLAMIRPIAMEH